MEAAVRGNADLLKLAMLHDPLVGAVCDPPEVWQMTDEMLVAQADWLPQYAREITKAKKRLASEKRLGTNTTKGAARIKVRTVAQLRKDRAAAARTVAADKAAAAPGTSKKAQKTPSARRKRTMK
jgi:alpha-galactosidase